MDLENKWNKENGVGVMVQLTPKIKAQGVSQMSHSPWLSTHGVSSVGSGLNRLNQGMFLASDQDISQ